MKPLRRMARTWLLAALPLALGALTAGWPPGVSADAPEDTDIAGHWEGMIILPGAPLDIKVDLALEAGHWSGTIDIPAQAALGLPLGDIHVSGREIAFAIVGIPGEPTFRGALKESEITGKFTQGGQTFDFTLGREETVGPARPQEPEPPFPYSAEEVEYRHADITLAGTLTIPPGEGRFPGVVLISGSGPQNRNEEVFDHRPFLVLADYLSRRGVAVLRSDDRGVGGSSGELGESTTHDLMEDALAAVRFLKKHPRIEGESIGLLGHSEGGLIAPLAAVRSEDVAFVVMMAGPGVPGDEILSRQTEHMFQLAGAGGEELELALKEHREFLQMVKDDAESDELRAQLWKMVRGQTAALTAGDESPPQEVLEELVEKTMKDAASPWFRYFLSYDPRPTLRQVRVPTLVLAGELDRQVDPEQNLPPIREALEKAGNRDFTVREFPGLNHLFQKAETGTPQEYYFIEETINPKVLDAIARWLTDRFIDR